MNSKPKSQNWAGIKPFAIHLLLENGYVPLAHNLNDYFFVHRSLENLEAVKQVVCIGGEEEEEEMVCVCVEGRFHKRSEQAVRRRRRRGGSMSCDRPLSYIVPPLGS